MEEKKKKLIGFNIIKSDLIDGYGGFGVGVFSFDNIFFVFVDVEEKEVFVDIGVMYVCSIVEKGIKFLLNKEEVLNGKLYWFVWVMIDRREEGFYYVGVIVCELMVDRSIRRGYKLLFEYVNLMDKLMKWKIIIDKMDDSLKCVFGEFLKNYD